jgi:hypothetical protein
MMINAIFDCCWCGDGDFEVARMKLACREMTAARREDADAGERLRVWQGERMLTLGITLAGMARRERLSG